MQAFQLSHWIGKLEMQQAFDKGSAKCCSQNDWHFWLHRTYINSHVQRLQASVAYIVARPIVPISKTVIFSQYLVQSQSWSFKAACTSLPWIQAPISEHRQLKIPEIWQNQVFRPFWMHYCPNSQNEWVGMGAVHCILIVPFSLLLQILFVGLPRCELYLFGIFHTLQFKTWHLLLIGTTINQLEDFRRANNGF